MRTTEDLAAADRQHVWHPFTQQQGWSEEEPVVIERAEGTNLYDTDGNVYIDGVSSLWCNVTAIAIRRSTRPSALSSGEWRTRRCSASHTRRRSSSPSDWWQSRQTG